jgi:hypothetical protein
MIEYEVAPERSEFLLGEEVMIRVHIANHRAESIQVPDPEMRVSNQPVFQLVGSAWPEGIRFTSNRILPPGNLPPSEGQKLITIKAGGTWTGRFSLQPMLHPAPGEYELTSNLQWGDVRAESKPSRFRVQPPHMTSAHIGLGLRPNESAEGEGAFIQSDASGSQIYSFTFIEVRPSIGEAKIDPPLHRFTAGAGASDIAVPWRKAPFFNEFVRWIIWREGRTLRALSSASERPVSIEVPVELERVVLPPVKATNGPVEVLVLAQDRGRLFLAEFSGKTGEGSGRLSWNTALPARPSGITAALESDSAEGYRHVAFVAERDGGFDIYHARYMAGSPPQSFGSVHVAAARPLTGAEPTLFIEPDGRARVAVIALANGNDLAVEVVEAVFERATTQAKVHASTPRDLPARAIDGGLFYTDRPGVPARLEGVIAVEGNRLFKLDQALMLVPVMPGITPSRILLAPGRQTTYIFCVDPERGMSICAL